MNSQISTKKNIRLGLLVAGIIALVLITITRFSAFLGRIPVSFVVGNSQPAAGVFVSKLSPAMVSLLVNPDTLQRLEQKGEFSLLKKRLLAKSNIDYKNDIKPWLSDEITLAVATIDIDRDPTNGLQTGYLMALKTAEIEKSREFLELLFSERAFTGANLGVEKYQGIKVIYDHFEDSQLEKIQNNLAGAIVNNFVLLSNHPKIIKEAINNLQVPDLSLVSSLEYQKASQQIPDNSLAVTFLNLPLVSKWQGLELAGSTYNSQILSLILNSQGVLAESTFLTPGEVIPPSVPLSKPVTALKYIPESTALAIAGSNLNNLDHSDLGKLWTQVTATIYGANEDAISRLVKPLVDIQKSWSLNFNQDIFRWVTGEYALALLPDADTSPHWLFVVEKTPDLAVGIAHLDQIASSHDLNISSLTLDGQKISAWTQITATSENNQSIIVDTTIKAVHTTLDNCEIFSSDLETLTAVLSQKQKSLLENSQFKNAVTAIPQPNQGYIYLDWENGQDILKHQLPILKFVEVLGKPLFENLRSLTVSSYSSKPGTIKGGVFFQLH
ncbi:MAG: DUF3352 domain-containing protein [Cuspidothrix sp.]